MAKLLLVEDDDRLAQKLARWLKQDGHIVDVVQSGADGLQMLQNYRFDVAIIDWGLPEIEGIDVLKKFRAGGGMTPIIFLTGRGDIASKKTGLDSGADDYIAKPFELDELSARVRSIMRRPGVLINTELKVGNVTLDPAGRKVFLSGQQIVLGRLEYAALEFLMRHQGRGFSTRELMENVWPSDSESTDVAVRSCIKNLRDKLSSNNSESIIKHIQNYGYTASD